MDVKKTLLSKLKELQFSMRIRDGVQIEETAEEIEKVRSQSDRDLEVARLNRDALTAQEVLAALQRVDESEYGRCIECEEPISERRLRALPWAARCIACQERRDIQGREARGGYEPAMARGDAG
jgi:DnaK suppressor protein